MQYKIVSPDWTCRISVEEGTVVDGGRRRELVGMTSMQLTSACVARGWILRRS